MQQHALEEFGEARREARWASCAARQGEERGRIGAIEAEAFSPLGPPARVAPQQHEVAVVGHQHKAIGREITAHLGAVGLHRQISRDIVNFHHASFRGTRFRPFLQWHPARRHEQPHVRKPRATVPQIRHAEDARLEALSRRVQRSGQRAIVADLACAGARGADAGDFRKVVRQDLLRHLSPS